VIDAERPPIAPQLRRAKDAKGCTWRDVAVALDVTERMVSKWASGESEPIWPNIVKLAAFFGVEPGYFYLSPPEGT
jgi:transcriptional regulator with XRE-family HTH domain